LLDHRQNIHFGENKRSEQLVQLQISEKEYISFFNKDV